MNRRELLARTLAAGALGATTGAAAARTRDSLTRVADEAAQPASAGSSQPKKALFVYGGWPGHEPLRCRDLWVPWLESQGFSVTAADTLEPYADAALMKSVDVVVQIWTMGEIRKEQLAGLLEAVRDGAGLAGWHGGLVDAFRQEPEYGFLVGGRFLAHPGGIIDYGVSIVDREDPITAGIEDFRLQSEQYYMHVDPNNKVLATTRFDGAHAPWLAGATMPVVWKRHHGKGRVFFSALGHTAADFQTSQVFEIAQRGVLWASQSRHAAAERLVSPVYASR